jgi:DNA-binding NarL/FixJ family response regulator
MTLPPGVALFLHHQQRRDQQFGTMHSVIIADDQELFRIGLSALLMETGEYRVLAEYPDECRVGEAIGAMRPSLVVASVRIVRDMGRLMRGARKGRSRVLLVAEDSDSLNFYRSSGAAGIVHRSASPFVFLQVVQKSLRGAQFVLPVEGMPGLRLRPDLAMDLSPTELTILALLMEGLKNCRIAEHLDVPNHVVAGRLQSIFNKTGFSNRLELALFLSRSQNRAPGSEFSERWR